jgi:hypothetical protein
MEIHNGTATLTVEALSCFTRAPTRVVLRPGESLYRFGTIVSATFRGNEIFSSPWWIPAETYQRITKTAHRTNQPIGDVARSRLAVATEWNPDMDWLTILELKKHVYAWVGPAKPQPFSGGHRSVMLLGNYDQAYVPDLAPPGTMTSEAGTLAYFGAAPA